MSEILGVENIYIGNELIETAYVGDEVVWGLGTGLYAHYKSHISPFDGFYNSHAYDAVFVKNGYLYVFYTQAPHHFTAKTDSTTALCLIKYNLSTDTVVSVTEILRPARCFWHGVEVNGTYYLFSESGTKYRLATTDFENFTETTWTAPNGFSNINYICLCDNGRLVCTTGRTTTGCYIYYSDDIGLTWTQASGYSSAITTHGGLIHLGNGNVVIYCQDSYSGNTDASTSSHDTKRVVMVSEDNGETWAGSLCQDADLLDCGITYSSGSFCKIGDTWYFCTSRRQVDLQESGSYTLGDIRLFSGTEQDLLNGSMSLFKTIDVFDTETSVITSGKIAIQSDSGNMCMRTDGESLHIVYHKPLLHQDGSYSESTSMTVYVRVDNVRGNKGKDDFYNPNWITERDSFVSLKDTSYDLYAYGSVTNFMSGIFDKSDYAKIEDNDIVPQNKVIIPFVNEFDLVAVFYPTNRMISGSWTDQYVGANIDGDVFVFGGTTNAYALNVTDSTNGRACSLGTTGGRYQYFRLKLKNGVVSATLNGRTISNLKCPAILGTRDIEDGTIVITMGNMETFLQSYTASAKVKGFSALAINTDGDISGFL